MIFSFYFMIYITMKMLLRFQVKIGTEHLMFLMLSYVVEFVKAKADKATAFARKQKCINSRNVWVTDYFIMFMIMKMQWTDTWMKGTYHVLQWEHILHWRGGWASVCKSNYRLYFNKIIHTVFIYWLLILEYLGLFPFNIFSLTLYMIQIISHGYKQDHCKQPNLALKLYCQ